MKELNSNKTRFPRFDKILVFQPIAEVYGEGNERQLCYRRLKHNVQAGSVRLSSENPFRSNTELLTYASE